MSDLSWFRQFLDLTSRPAWVLILAALALLGLDRAHVIELKSAAAWVPVAVWAAFAVGGAVVVASLAVWGAKRVNGGLQAQKAKKERADQAALYRQQALDNMALLSNEEAHLIFWVFQHASQRFRAYLTTSALLSLRDKKIIFPDPDHAQRDVWVVVDAIWETRANAPKVRKDERPIELTERSGPVF